MADVRVIGVDGVRERWVAATLTLDPDGGSAPAVAWTVGPAAEVLAPVAEPDVVAAGVDMPVGLVERGLRSCEAAARERLGRGASSIFTTAPVAAFRVARTRLRAHGGLDLASRAEADAASRASGGGGVSTQSWMIAAKVLEVEDAVRALGPAGERVVEVHPETSYAVMARHFGLGPVPSKLSAPGVALRVRLLERTLPGLDVLTALAEVPVGTSARERVPVDDALDALAGACSALRHAYGQAQVLGAGTDAVWSDGAPAPGRAVIVV
ncbi:DUF429 domain-containing protein [Jannaschia sp. R86511]|uniref:DUF429 domain-containing protein n=1 Tax=Jannaschia sp. R86511 TaxID=3093853 RepID=UPI0036D23302